MERGMTADQVLAALWRRKLLIAAIAAAVFAIGAAVVIAQPSLSNQPSASRFSAMYAWARAG